MGQILLPPKNNSGKRAKRPKRLKRARGVMPSRHIELRVRKHIVDSMGPLAGEIAYLVEWLEGTATPAEAAQVMRDLQERWRQDQRQRADEFAQTWVDEVSADAKEQLQASIAGAIGLDMTHIFDDALIANTASLMSVEAAALIRDIPDQMVEDVRRAVLAHFQGLPQPDDRSLTQHRREIIKDTNYRANVIARDQTSKMNTAINQARQQAIGIEEYIWRTQEDRRVAGNPDGKFPKGNAMHGNHYKLNGKKFRWDDPPKEGGFGPGSQINCRCWAEPVIEMDKLRNAA
jgi:SPP1 gp7 family putative phage head morphogenesis protein